MTKRNDGAVEPEPESGEPKSGEPTSGEPEVRRCRWCRVVLPIREGRGRPRQFCSQKCRQWEWVSRQRAAELELSEGELIVARAELHGLLDDLYVLSCAVADTQRDLADGLAASADPGEIFLALQWLLEAAAPLAERRLGAGSERP